MKKRIFKFRVWDTHLETYTYDAHLYHEFIKWLADDRYVVEQFTGLTDRNQKEIYENDILGRVYVTKKGFFDLKVVKYYSSWSLNIEPSAYLMECEILGNKHQAAELIT